MTPGRDRAKGLRRSRPCSCRFYKNCFFYMLADDCQGQTLDNEACIFGMRIAVWECPVAKEAAVEHERIELGWKQFEGKKKYLYWNSVEARPAPAGDGGETPEDIQRQRDAKDAEARSRGLVQP
jgi:hypothetical protein